MRVTQSMMSRMSMDQLQLQKNRLARTQEQASTGRRLNRPSDDPVDYRSTLRLKDSLSQTGRYLRSIDLSRTRIRATEEAIADSTEIVATAKTKALQARNTANGPTARAAIRVEVEQLFDQLLDASNTRAAGGGYVFSGVASDTAAFAQTGSFTAGSPPPTVSFEGDDSAVSVEIDEGVMIEVTRSGAQVFQGSVDLFAVLGQLWQGIDQNDTALIDTAIGDLDRALDQLNVERANVGGADAKADSFEQRLRGQEQELTSQVSTLEDVDAYQVYSDLAAQQTALQASLAVTARMQQPTLLDFL
ncbi:flagellar hook-associated protein FlgL [Myxococcota bacterium]|nr:flagellar hook-associated protein FlgL [Myxococcota bacterium]